MSSADRERESWKSVLPSKIETLEVEVQALRQARDRLREQNAALVALSRSTATEDDPEKVFTAITEAAARMMQSERASAWLFNASRSAIQCIDMFSRKSNDHARGMTLEASDFPRYFDALESGRTVSASDAQSDPRTSEFTEQYLIPNGITSMLDAPIRSDGQVVGVICHEHVGPARVWTPEDEVFAGSIADLASITLGAAERREAEHTLRREKDISAKIIDSMPGIFYLFDENGRYLRWNKNFEVVSGYSAQEMTERRPTDFIPPENAAEIERRIAAVFSDGRATVEADFVAKDGRRTPYLFTGVRVEFEGRLCLAGAGIDLTERHLAEQALRESERRLRQVLDINPALIFAKDRKGRFTLVNQSLADVYGTTVERIIGRTDSEFDQNTEEVEFFRRIDLEVMDSKSEHRVPEEPVTDANGNTHWFQTVKRPIVGDDGVANQVLGVATDITERKNAEERQNLMMRELDHRVKNNLAAILSIADATVLGAADLDAFAVDFRGRIQAMAVAHEMLARTSWKGAELSSMTERLLLPYEESDASRIALTGPSLLLPVSLAPTIAMVMHELATNAMKHGALSVPAGRVQIAWEVIDRTRLELTWTESDGPRIELPTKRGFGLDFIEQVVEYQLAGSVDVQFDPAGLRCHLCLPLESAERDALAPGM